MLRVPAQRRAALLTLLGLVAALLHVVVQAPAAEAAAVKTPICHRTSSEGNPYRRISVRQSALNTSGHGGHRGGVYPAPGWGDIWNGGPVAWTQQAQDVFAGITRTPVAKGGRVACRAMSALQYFDAMEPSWTTPAPAASPTPTSPPSSDEMQANEDKALLAALGLTSFTAASMTRSTSSPRATDATRTTRPARPLSCTVGCAAARRRPPPPSTTAPTPSS
jgi:hypothetical protein